MNKIVTEIVKISKFDEGIARIELKLVTPVKLKIVVSREIDYDFDINVGDEVQIMIRLEDIIIAPEME